MLVGKKDVNRALFPSELEADVLFFKDGKKNAHAETSYLSKGPGHEMRAILGAILTTISLEAKADLLNKTGFESVDSLVAAIDFANIPACLPRTYSHSANDDFQVAPAQNGPAVGIRAGAKHLGISVSTYYELIREGGPRYDPHCPKPTKLTNRRCIIRVAALDNYISYKASLSSKGAK